MGALGVPKGPTGTPREPRAGQGELKASKMSSEDIQKRLTNHKTIYTQKKCTQAPMHVIQRPASKYVLDIQKTLTNHKTIAVGPGGEGGGEVGVGTHEDITQSPKRF